MKELAMHVYDLMENSTAANAKDVKLTIVDSLKNNDFHFTIEDNGKGMSPEFLAKVTDPYTTSRTTRAAAHQDEHREMWRRHETYLRGRGGYKAGVLVRAQQLGPPAHG